MDDIAGLTRVVSATSFGELDDEVIAKAKEAIMDFVGVATYGSAHEASEKVRTYVERFEDGKEGTVISGGSASATGAALANGVFGHAEDYDDSFFDSFPGHPTSPVFPSALAAAELDDANGKELITAYIVGVEVLYRLEESIRPGHVEQGFHTSGTVATFGSAAAAGFIFDLSPDEIETAFGISASCSSSLYKNFGTMTKPYHAGHAAQMGLRAALLAREGFTADSDVFVGDMGYPSVMGAERCFTPESLSTEPDDRWAVMKIGYKPYPSGVFTHSPMEALRKICEDRDIDPESVDNVTVTMTEYADRALQHTDPTTELEAKFSVEFCLAAILLAGDPGIHEFSEEFIQSEQTRAQMEKVQRVPVAELFEDEFGYGAKVTVEMSTGAEYTREESHPVGSTNNQMSEERFKQKFRECAETAFTRDTVGRIEESIERLDELENVHQFTSVLSGDTGIPD